VAWANERRAWFDDVDAAAAAFGEKAVFVGKTPAKVIFSRPTTNPENNRWNATYATYVATDLMQKGYRVFSLEPWYWNDHGANMEAIHLQGGRTYWTDTGVVVPCACGEFARFYELHATNATLKGVARLEAGGFTDAPEGLLTGEGPAFFYPERAVHTTLGKAKVRSATVKIHYRDIGNGTHEAGFWNLPLEAEKNRHPLLTWTGTGTGANKTATFHLPPTQVINGGLYLSGDPLLVRGLEVAAG
jgi:hypothetical protein